MKEKAWYRVTAGEHRLPLPGPIGDAIFHHPHYDILFNCCGDGHWQFRLQLRGEFSREEALERRCEELEWRLAEMEAAANADRAPDPETHPYEFDRWNQARKRRVERHD